MLVIKISPKCELSTTVSNPGRRDRAFELATIDLEEPGAVEGEVRDERGDPVSRRARRGRGRAPSYLPAGRVAARRGRHRRQRAPSACKVWRGGATTIDVFSPDRGARLGARRSAEQPHPVRACASPCGRAAASKIRSRPGGVAVTLGERRSRHVARSRDRRRGRKQRGRARRPTAGATSSRP